MNTSSKNSVCVGKICINVISVNAEAESISCIICLNTVNNPKGVLLTISCTFTCCNIMADVFLSFFNNKATQITYSPLLVSSIYNSIPVKYIHGIYNSTKQKRHMHSGENYTKQKQMKKYKKYVWYENQRTKSKPIHTSLQAKYKRLILSGLKLG